MLFSIDSSELPVDTNTYNPDPTRDISHRAKTAKLPLRSFISRGEKGARSLWELTRDGYSNDSHAWGERDVREHGNQRVRVKRRMVTQEDGFPKRSKPSTN